MEWGLGGEKCARQSAEMRLVPSAGSCDPGPFKLSGVKILKLQHLRGFVSKGEHFWSSFGGDRDER